MLYTPLLAGSAVGTLESRDIVYPTRPLSRKRNFTFHQGAAIKLDSKNKIVYARPHNEEIFSDKSNRTIADSSSVNTTPNSSEGIAMQIPYDYLIVGIGAEPATFGIPGVRENVFFLKEAIDGYRIRTKLHDLFEAASLPLRIDANRSILEQQQEYE
uniref:NADH:ubiquinone reductase (non-electrogenic) n=1 Tax=Lygus hesperus TaxID=30085 RepID=A0A0A9ZGJ2_LYGHE